MATLAQLLDKPAPPLNYVSSTSSPSATKVNGPDLSIISMTQMDQEEEEEIQYRRPFSKKEVVTLDSVVVSSSTNRFKLKSGLKSQSPGSRLSLIATSLPHPRVSQSGSSPSGHQLKIKYLPGLSPIGSSSFAKDNSHTLDDMDGGAEFPCIVSVKSLASKSRKIDKRVQVVEEEDLDDPGSPEYQRGYIGEPDIVDDGIIKPNKKTKNRIKRPLNAFMVWSKLHRRKIMDKDPTVHHSLISKQLGAGWKSLSTAQRLPYYQEAKRLSELHSQIYPDYKYQPRKRSKGSPYPQLGFESRHSISGSGDLSTSKGDSLLKVDYKSGSFIRRSLDGSLDLSMKRSHPQGMSSMDTGLLGRRNSCFSSTTTYSESDSADSSLELRQPLNMSLKSSGADSEVSGNKSWSRCYEEESESDEDRLVIDEKDA